MKLFIRFALNSCFQDDDQDKLYQRMEDLNHKLGEATILLPLVLVCSMAGPSFKDDTYLNICQIKEEVRVLRRDSLRLCRPLLEHHPVGGGVGRGY